MIDIREDGTLRNCGSCGKLTSYLTQIVLCREQNAPAMYITLCDECRNRLMTLLSFRRNKDAAEQ